MRPPGAAAARRTVRRRRTGMAVVAVIAAGLAIGLPLGSHSARPVEPAQSAAPPGTLNERGQQASLAVGVDNRTGRGQVLAIHDIADMTANLRVVDGDYALRIVCIGPGAVELTVNDQPMDMRCALSPPPDPMELLVPPVGGYVQIRVSPDVVAAGQTAVAYQLELSDRDRGRLAERARAALPAPGGSATPVTAGFLAGRVGLELRAAPTPADYRVDITCVGVGLLRLNVELVTDDDQVITAPVAGHSSTCTPTTRLESFTVTVPANQAAALKVLISPDPDATGQAAAAVRLVRL